MHDFNALLARTRHHIITDINEAQQEYYTDLVNEFTWQSNSVKFHAWYRGDTKVQIEANMARDGLVKTEQPGADYIWRAWQNAMHAFRVHGPQFKLLQDFRAKSVADHRPTASTSNIPYCHTPRAKRSRVPTGSWSHGVVLHEPARPPARSPSLPRCLPPSIAPCLTLRAVAIGSRGVVGGQGGAAATRGTPSA